MNDILKIFFDRVTRYDWLTTILPGVFCVELCESFGMFTFPDGLLKRAVLYYFIGLICSRLGATVIEPIAKIKRFGLFAEYGDYVSWKEAKPDSADILITNSNLFRSFSGMMILIICTHGYTFLVKKYPCLEYASQPLICILLLVLFVDGYRRQLLFISKRVNKFIESQREK